MQKAVFPFINLEQGMLMSSKKNLYESKSKSNVYHEWRHENQVGKHGSWLGQKTQTELNVKVRHSSLYNK